MKKAMKKVALGAMIAGVSVAANAQITNLERIKAEKMVDAATKGHLYRNGKGETQMSEVAPGIIAVRIADDAGRPAASVLVLPKQDIVMMGDAVKVDLKSSRIAILKAPYESSKTSFLGWFAGEVLKNAYLKKKTTGNEIPNASTQKTEKTDSVDEWRSNVLSMLGFSGDDVVPVTDGGERYALVIMDHDCPYSRDAARWLKLNYEKLGNVRLDMIAIPALGDGVDDAWIYEKGKSGKEALDVISSGAQTDGVSQRNIKKVQSLLEKAVKAGISQTPTMIVVRPDGTIKTYEAFDRKAWKEALDFAIKKTSSVDIDKSLPPLHSKGKVAVDNKGG